MSTRTVEGTEAISYLVSHTFYKDHATIIESRAFIDVDDRGRVVETDSDSDYMDLMWTVLNYHPTPNSLKGLGYTVGEAIEGLYSAEIGEIKIGNRTAEVIKSFTIHTSLYDSESLGTVYEFNWEV